MTPTLVHPDVAAQWEQTYSQGTDKRYPSIDLVRLERWFFKGKPGRLLEYGMGSGVNLIHMLECDYVVDGMDAAMGSVKLVESKLANRPDLAGRYQLHQVAPDAAALPFEDETFDYVLSINVLSLLASRERVSQALAEFRRVLKPGGKIIADINAPEADFGRDMESLGDDAYMFKSGSVDGMPTYCPPEERFHELMAEHFEIDDRGFTSHGYFNSQITEYIVCAHKAP
jgi:ubiquinone/menaquinone biosynthesis C-methylase UbiE